MADVTADLDNPPTRHGSRWSTPLNMAAVAIALVVLTAGLIRWRSSASLPGLPSDFLKAWEAFEAQRTEEAEKYVENLMHQREHGSSYLVLDAAVSLHHGDFEAAETRIRASRATGKLRPFALEILGRSFYWRKKWYDAEQVFAILAKEDPQSYAAHLWLGVVYHDTHMFGQAMHELQLASKIQPNNPRSHILQASILFRYGRYHKAAAEYQLALRLIPVDAASNPTSTNPLITYLVRALVRDGQFEEGLKQIADVSDPSVELQVLRAECHLGLGQLADAEKECRLALERDEHEPAAATALAKIGLQQAVTQEHSQLLEAAFAANSYDPDMAFLLGQVHGRLGNKKRQQELHDRSQHLLKLRTRSLELMDVVWSQPEDVDSRLELAKIFEELGDAAQSQQWRQAAEGCQQRLASIKAIQR